MAAKNYYVYSEDAERLKTLKEEYESMGRDCKIDGNRLVVLSRPKPKEKVDKKPRERVESSDKEQRSKRRE